MSVKTRKPPHLAVAFATQPLHLVVLALTTAIHRRIVLVVTRPTETPKPRPANGTIRRPGARHAGASEQRRQRKRGSYRAGWTRRSIRWPEPRPAASPSTTRSSPSRRRPPSRARPRPLATATRQATPRRHAGPYGASFDGTDPNGKPAKGLTFERRWTRPGVHPYDEITWEYRTAGIANESGKSRLRAEGRRGPQLLVPARHERRGVQVLPRAPQHPGA